MHNVVRSRDEGDCRSIAYFLRKYSHNDGNQHLVRTMMLKDFCARVKRLPPAERLAAMAECWYGLLPQESRDEFGREGVGLVEINDLLALKKEKRHVGIVTVKECELRAVLATLGKNMPLHEDRASGAFRYWFGELVQNDGAKLSLVVTCVGEPRNVPCAIAVEHLVNDFALDLLMCVGIAAGPKDKVKLGDVVCADRVYDYEHVRLELHKLFGLFKLRKSAPRPLYSEVHKSIKLAAQIYEKKSMDNLLAQVLPKTDRERLPVGFPNTFAPGFHKGTIAAGEKLIADGSLRKMYRKVDQNIRAGDQEDSGFAQVAVLKEIRWCVFRGICDYADPNKGDNWQYVAALAASCAAMSFLQTVWRKITE